MARITLKYNALRSFIAKLLIKTHKVHKQTHTYTASIKYKVLRQLACWKLKYIFMRRFSLLLFRGPPFHSQTSNLCLGGSCWQLLKILKFAWRIFCILNKNNEKNKGENVQIVTQMSRCGKYERLTSQGILMNWKLKINKIRSKVGVYIWWEKKEREQISHLKKYNYENKQTKSKVALISELTPTQIFNLLFRQHISIFKFKFCYN